LRAFLALDLTNPEIRQQISEIQKQLQKSGADLKPVDPNLIHFTLRFFGEITEDDIDTIREKMSSISTQPFSISMRGLGVFPSKSHISVIWVGATKETSGRMEDLASGINSILYHVGERPDHPFRAHLTIARVRTGRNKESLLRSISQFQNFEFGDCHFNEIKLKKSTLTPKGPIYEDVLVFPFSSSPSSSSSLLLPTLSSSTLNMREGSNLKVSGSSSPPK
jgi:2'-5' RNA ligase